VIDTGVNTGDKHRCELSVFENLNSAEPAIPPLPPRFLVVSRCFLLWVAVISAKKHKHQRRKRQSVTAKREKSRTPKFLTAIEILPNLT